MPERFKLLKLQMALKAFLTAIPFVNLNFINTKLNLNTNKMVESVVF